MKTIGKLLTAGAVAASLICPVHAFTSNIDVFFGYKRYGSVVSSYLYEEKDGSFTAVTVSGEGALIVDKMDKDGVLDNTFKVNEYLDALLGFYAGEEFNFAVYGAVNYKEDDNTEVLRIVKYDKEFNELAFCSIKGANTQSPASAGSLRMAEDEGILYIHTCHTMYKYTDGLNHQSSMTFMINENDMTVSDSFYDIAAFQTGISYASHSFNQFVLADEGYVYFLDHGDASPRGVGLTKMQADGKIHYGSSTAVIYEIKGDYGDNDTGLTLSGFTASKDNLLSVGTSINQSDSSSYDSQRNIFLTVTDKDLKSTKTVNLTNYSNGADIYMVNVQIGKLNDDLFAVYWYQNNADTRRNSEGDPRIGKGNYRPCDFCWMLVDGDGNIVKAVQTSENVSSTDCAPITTSNGTVAWYVVEDVNNIRGIYEINAEGELSAKAGEKEMYRLYNKNSGEHFYTASAEEKNALVTAGWNYEGIGWTAPGFSLTPVYRLYNSNAGDHHYTTSAGEMKALVKAGWNYEGIGWYSDDNNGTALYRQYNPNAKTGTHNYTTNKKENDALVQLGWKEEGIGWYGVK